MNALKTEIGEDRTLQRLQALGISLYVTADTSRRALQGLTRCFLGG